MYSGVKYQNGNVNDFIPTEPINPTANLNGSIKPPFQEGPSFPLRLILKRELTHIKQLGVSKSCWYEEISNLRMILFLF